MGFILLTRQSHMGACPYDLGNLFKISHQSSTHTHIYIYELKTQYKKYFLFIDTLNVFLYLSMIILYLSTLFFYSVEWNVSTM